MPPPDFSEADKTIDFLTSFEKDSLKFAKVPKCFDDVGDYLNGTDRCIDPESVFLPARKAVENIRSWVEISLGVTRKKLIDELRQRNKPVEDSDIDRRLHNIQENCSWMESWAMSLDESLRSMEKGALYIHLQRAIAQVKIYLKNPQSSFIANPTNAISFLQGAMDRARKAKVKVYPFVPTVESLLSQLQAKKAAEKDKTDW